MNSFWTVVNFTVKNKVRGKAFLITTLIIALILTVGVNLPYLFTKFGNNDGTKVSSIGYIQSTVPDQSAGTATAEQLKSFFDQTENSGIKLIAYDDQGSADANEDRLKKAINDGEIKGYLTFGKMSDSGFPEMTYKTEKLMEHALTSSLQGALSIIRQSTLLQDAGLTAEQVAMLNAPISIDTVQISATEGAGNVGEGKTQEEQAMNMGVVYFLIILLFMSVMISGQMIASEITAEKSSRVMEILITSVAPLKQMFGKIFGMFVVVIAQIVFYVLVVFANLRLPHNVEALSSLNIDISQIDPMMIVYGLIYFLTGFFLFATMFAAIGSLVSRTEELGQAVMPMTILSLAGFYIAIFSISTPDSMLVKVTSFIPVFSPFVMPLRLGLTDPPVWEVLASVAILLVSIYVAVWISAKIYRTGVLMYGKRPSWKELRKAMKAYKV